MEDVAETAEAEGEGHSEHIRDGDAKRDWLNNAQTQRLLRFLKWAQDEDYRRCVDGIANSSTMDPKIIAGRAVTFRFIAERIKKCDFKVPEGTR